MESVYVVEILRQGMNPSSCSSDLLLWIAASRGEGKFKANSKAWAPWSYIALETLTALNSNELWSTWSWSREEDGAENFSAAPYI